MVRRTADSPEIPLRPSARPVARPSARVPTPTALRQPKAEPERALWGLGPLVILAFMLSLVVPGTLAVGPINLTIYRMVLLAVCLPLGLRWISGRAGPVGGIDLLFLGSAVWVSIALIVVHGMSRIIFIGTNFVELFGAYLVGRVLVRDAADHRFFLRAMLLLLVVLFPFAVLEFLTGNKLLHTIFGGIMSFPETSGTQQRLGFTRVATSFSHPIHFGLFGTMIFANAFFLFWRWPMLRRLLATALVGFAAMLSISSAALFSLVLQTAMILWDQGLAFLKSRWMIGLAIGAATIVFLLFSVQGGLFNYIVENLIFAQGAGEHRLDIYYYGTLEVLRHPWFGVGLNEWARPFWRPHPTIDSYWLMTAVRSGIPSILMLILALLFMILRISRARGLDEDGSHYRSGYLISLCGLILSLSTVHIWGPISVFIMVFLGAGSWFYTGEHRRARTEDPLRRRRARDAALVAGAAAPGAWPGRGQGQEAIVRPHTVGYDRTSAASGSRLAEDGVLNDGKAGRTVVGRGTGRRRPGRPPGSEYDVRDLPEAP